MKINPAGLSATFANTIKLQLKSKKLTLERVIDPRVTQELTADELENVIRDIANNLAQVVCAHEVDR